MNGTVVNEIDFTALKQLSKKRDELKEVEKDRINHLDDDNMLFILNSRIDLIRDDIAFCIRNIVDWHLSQKDRDTLNNLFPSKIDNSIIYNPQT